MVILMMVILMTIILMMVILKAGGCDSVFRATCPWDTAGMTNIAMKLMASQVMQMLIDADADSGGFWC